MRKKKISGQRAARKRAVLSTNETVRSLGVDDSITPSRERLVLSGILKRIIARNGLTFREFFPEAALILEEPDQAKNLDIILKKLRYVNEKLDYWNSMVTQKASA